MFIGYLCAPEANSFDIDFIRFKIRDMSNGCVLFEVSKSTSLASINQTQSINSSLNGLGSKNEEDENKGRLVKYEFTPEFLKLKTVGATLVSLYCYLTTAIVKSLKFLLFFLNKTSVEFTVGEKAVNNFRMIEKHFFKDRPLKTFDFDFGFCIPNSLNTCEHIYEFPPLNEELIQDMIKNPFATRSDSFYFVDNKLIMHNKADYAYNGGF